MRHIDVFRAARHFHFHVSEKSKPKKSTCAIYINYIKYIKT